MFRLPVLPTQTTPTAAKHLGSSGPNNSCIRRAEQQPAGEQKTKEEPVREGGKKIPVYKNTSP